MCLINRHPSKFYSFQDFYDAIGWDGGFVRYNIKRNFLPPPPFSYVLRILQSINNDGNLPGLCGENHLARATFLRDYIGTIP